MFFLRYKTGFIINNVKNARYGLRRFINFINVLSFSTFYPYHLIAVYPPNNIMTMITLHQKNSNGTN